MRVVEIPGRLLLLCDQMLICRRLLQILIQSREFLSYTVKRIEIGEKKPFRCLYELIGVEEVGGGWIGKWVGKVSTKDQPDRNALVNLFSLFASQLHIYFNRY